MFVYEKKLQYPVKIKNPNPRLAAAIISQYGGPDGELGASLRYLSQRYSMPYPELKGLLTDIGTEELGHLEMVGTIVHQLTRNLTEEQIKEAGFEAYFVDHTTGELCPQTSEEYDSFRRVTFRQEGILEDDALAEKLSEHRQVLCIVNSRKAAQSTFARLPQEASFHLSTLMVPAQRQTLLDEIRRRLKAGEPCRVVSTSLIEAGVDVDFPAVYRELAGLDSVLQAAGRCNREGKRAPEESIVTVFERAELPPMLFRTAIGATREALMNSCDIGARETMQNYFDALRSLSGETLDKSGVIKAFEKGINGCELPFRTVAENFHLIDQNTRTVYVPFAGGAALIERLKAGECSKELYRKLGRYAVSVYEPHFQKLYAAGALLTAREVPALDEDSAILNDMSLYSETTGLTLEPEMGKAEFI